MIQIGTVNSAQLVAAATAISAVGFLTVGATAQADPMIPLAPPCDQWSFPGDVVIREGGTGWDVSFSSAGQAAGGPATATGPGGTKSGNISGTMTNRGHVELTVRYDNGQFQGYVGDVGDDAKLHGVTRNNVPNESGIPWSTVSPISCSNAPLELPIPEEVPEPGPQPPPPKEIPAGVRATVNGDVDVYERPNINNDQKPLGILRSGTQVRAVQGETEGQPCVPNSWCLVIGDVPTGKGFIWGHLDLAA